MSRFRSFGRVVLGWLANCLPYSAGMYVPYIAYHMLEAKDMDYYNVAGIQINDPSINYDDTMTEGCQPFRLMAS